MKKHQWLEAAHSDQARDLVAALDEGIAVTMKFMLDIHSSRSKKLWAAVGAVQTCLERGMSVRLDNLWAAEEHCLILQDDPRFIESWKDQEGIKLSLNYTADAISELTNRAFGAEKKIVVVENPSAHSLNLYTLLKRSHLLPYERRIELQERIIKSNLSAELIEKRGGVGSIPHQVLSILQTNLLVDNEVFEEEQLIALKELEEAGIVEWREGEGAWRMWRVENIVWHRDARLDWRLPGMNVKVSTWFKDECYHVGFEYDPNQWGFLKKVIGAVIADYGAAGLRAETTVTGHIVARMTFDYQLAFDNEFRARDFIEEIMKYLREQKENGAA